MSPMTDYLENQLRTQIFRTGSGLGKPSGLFIALFTTPTSDNGDGTEVLSGTGYARLQADPLDATWTGGTSTDGITNNASNFVFTTATSDWGTITHAAIFDQGSAGNMLIHGALSASVIVNNNDQFSFDTGNFIVTFT